MVSVSKNFWLVLFDWVSTLFLKFEVFILLGISVFSDLLLLADLLIPMITKIILQYSVYWFSLNYILYFMLIIKTIYMLILDNTNIFELFMVLSDNGTMMTTPLIIQSLIEMTFIGCYRLKDFLKERNWYYWLFKYLKVNLKL